MAHSGHAVRHAEVAIALGESMELTCFDRATLHGSAALAYGRGGRTADAARHRELHRAACQSVDPDERPLLESISGRE